MKINFGTNFAIFVIFFAIALIEAFQKQNWLEAALFAALGVSVAQGGQSKECIKILNSYTKISPFRRARF